MPSFFESLWEGDSFFFLTIPMSLTREFDPPLDLLALEIPFAGNF